MAEVVQVDTVARRNTSAADCLSRIVQRCDLQMQLANSHILIVHNLMAMAGMLC